MYKSHKYFYGLFILLLPAVILSLFGCSDSYTVVLLPDTQYYTEESTPITYKAQTQWIADNRDDQNIKFVIHLGDITDDNAIREWVIASEAHQILDSADIDYSMIPGNHDNPDHGRKRNTSLYNSFFGPEKFVDKPWYGGHMGNVNDNNYTFFEF